MSARLLTGAAAFALAFGAPAAAQTHAAGHGTHAPARHAQHGAAHGEDGAAAHAAGADGTPAAHAAQAGGHGHAAAHAAPPHDGPAAADEAHAHAAPAASDDLRPPPDHVAPPPPAHVMGEMAPAAMVEVMGMDDRAPTALFALDRFERAEGGALAWSAQARMGGDFDRLHLRTEGERADGRVEHADVEVLWGHAVAPFWDSQLGLRRDVGHGPDRTWAAFGVQGLAPYWFEVSATAYLGQGGRTALRVETDYDLLLTQRLVLQPRLELNAYGRDDPARGIGAGLSDASAGLRLRYEIRRELAPYVGIEWTRRFGATADFARAAGDDVRDVRWVVGLRAWF